MLGFIRTSDTSQTGLRSLYPLPSFLSKNQLAKEGPDSVALVVIPALDPHWISHSRVTGHCVQLEHHVIIWTGPQAEQGIDICLLQEGF